MSTIYARIGLVQRVLPAYRVPLFDALAAQCSRGMGLFAGRPRSGEMIDEREIPHIAQLNRGQNIHLLSGKWMLVWQSGLMTWLNRFAPDVLILEANPRYLVTPAAARWMHRQQKPVIGWGLGAPPITGPLAGFRSRSRRRFLKNFDAILTYSGRGAEEYAAAGVDPARIFVAPNAVTFKPTQALPERTPRFAGLPVVLFVGRLQARKRVDFLLRACAALPEELRPRLWIVGDGPERENLVRLAESVYPAAEFFGAVSGEALAPLFRDADLFVLPGTGGLAVQEAMSFGLPVITAEADGTQVDLVRPGNGWQIQGGNLDELVQTMTRALSDPLLLREMGAESYRIVAEEINLDHMVEVFGRAIQSVWKG